MATQYTAQVRTKRGKLKFTSKPHDTREAAAREAFTADEGARECSTGYGFGGGFDIRWHRRADIMSESDPAGARHPHVGVGHCSICGHYGDDCTGFRCAPVDRAAADADTFDGDEA